MRCRVFHQQRHLKNAKTKALNAGLAGSAKNLGRAETPRRKEEKRKTGCHR